MPGGCGLRGSGGAERGAGRPFKWLRVYLLRFVAFYRAFLYLIAIYRAVCAGRSLPAPWGGVGRAAAPAAAPDSGRSCGGGGGRGRRGGARRRRVRARAPPSPPSSPSPPPPSPQWGHGWAARARRPFRSRGAGAPAVPREESRGGWARGRGRGEAAPEGGDGGGRGRGAPCPGGGSGGGAAGEGATERGRGAGEGVRGERCPRPPGSEVSHGAASRALPGRALGGRRGRGSSRRSRRAFPAAGLAVTPFAVRRLCADWRRDAAGGIRPSASVLPPVSRAGRVVTRGADICAKGDRRRSARVCLRAAGAPRAAAAKSRSWRHNKAGPGDSGSISRNWKCRAEFPRGSRYVWDRTELWALLCFDIEVRTGFDGRLFLEEKSGPQWTFCTSFVPEVLLCDWAACEEHPCVQITVVLYKTVEQMVVELGEKNCLTSADLIS